MKKSSRSALLALLLGLAFSPAAQARSGPPLVLAWMGDGQPLADDKLNSYVADMARTQPQADHIVFLIHGYSDTRKDSEVMYKSVSTLMDQAYGRQGQKVLVVGLQWHAALAGNAIPWKAVPDYLKAVGKARAVGHVPMRQLIFRLRKQYPQAQISVLTHSLGCEVGVACAYPDINYTDTLAKSDAFQPQQPIALDELVLGQGDIDYDIWYNTKVQLLRPQPVAKMLWMSVCPYVGRSDETLTKRAQVRGKAGATRFPRMTTDQYDGLFKSRAVLFDGKDTQREHQFVDFYNQDRLNRMADVAIYLGKHRRGAEPKELADLDKILALPKDVKVLLPWLNSPNMASQYYALWRIEGIVDGGSQHFADETIDKVDLLLRNKPRAVWDERKTSKCTSIRQGYWPTQAQMTRAGAPAWAKDNP